MVRQESLFCEQVSDTRIRPTLATHAAVYIVLQLKQAGFGHLI